MEVRREAEDPRASTREPAEGAEARPWGERREEGGDGDERNDGGDRAEGRSTPGADSYDGRPRGP